MGAPQRGARSATGRRKHGLGWLPWVAFLLLIVLLVAAYLIATAIDDDDTDVPAVSQPAASTFDIDVPADT